MWGPQGATSGGLGTHFKTRRPFACLPPSFQNHQSKAIRPSRGSWRPPRVGTEAAGHVGAERAGRVAVGPASPQTQLATWLCTARKLRRALMFVGLKPVKVTTVHGAAGGEGPPFAVRRP